MKKYTTCLLVALMLFGATSFAQTIIVTELKRPIESASEVRFTANEITLSNVKITCETLTIAATVTRINISGNVEIRCKRLAVATGTTIQLIKTGANDALLGIWYETYAPNNLTLQTGTGEVQVTLKKQ